MKEVEDLSYPKVQTSINVLNWNKLNKQTNEQKPGHKTFIFPGEYYLTMVLLLTSL